MRRCFGGGGGGGGEGEGGYLKSLARRKTIPGIFFGEARARLPRHLTTYSIPRFAGVEFLALLHFCRD